MNQDHDAVDESHQEATAHLPSESPEPQPPPPDPQSPAQQPVFYAIDYRKVTFAELWRSTPSLSTLPNWALLKLFGNRVPASTDDLPVESLRPFETSPEEMDQKFREFVETQTRFLTELGFHSPVFHSIADVAHKTQSCLASFGHSSLPIVARLHLRAWAIKTPAPCKVFAEFISANTDGTFLWSLTGRTDLQPPPSCQVIRREKEGARELFTLHREALASAFPIGGALPASTTEQTLDIVESLHDTVRDFHLARGVFVPPSPKQRARKQFEQDSVDRAVARGSKHPLVFLEIEKQQRPRTGWAGPFLLLVLSLGFFLLIGIRGVSLWRVLALVPILLFHELGHFLAMKAFGYRNLRMFFIPGFGAAVSGRHYNVPGWKKAIVYLMGPVPGIVLGIVLGLSGIIWKSDLALQAALLTLLINGFNLLPIFPLDGGHIAHIVLFSRQYMLDIAVRALAAVALGILGAYFGGYLFIGLAVLMLASLPFALRVGRVVRDLRREGATPADPDDHEIPPEVAERIIDKLAADAKSPQTPLVLANQTTQVYEALNTKLPGWAASLGLGAVHLASFIAAAFFGLVFAAAQDGSLHRFMQTAANRPEHLVTSWQTQDSPAQSAPQGPTRAVVANFSDSKSAEAAFVEAQTRQAPGESVTRFADTVFVRFPDADDEARKRWLTKFEQQGAKTFVESAKLQTVVRIFATTPGISESKSLTGELNDYFGLPLDERMIAPWSPNFTVSPQQRSARETYRSLSKSEDLWRDPQYKALTERRRKAFKNGDAAEAEALSKEQDDLLRSLRRQKILGITQSSDGVDQELAREYLELFDALSDEDFYTTASKQLAPRLGQLPEPEPATPGNADLTYAFSGHAEWNGTIVQMFYVRFQDAPQGAAALCEWLRAKGCTQLRYDIEGEETYDDED